MVLTPRTLIVMLTLRFDYIIILMFSNGIWTAFLATPVLALQLEPPIRVVHRIAILAVEGTTMILWFVCFTTLATLSPPNHCEVRSCVVSGVIILFGAMEWYAMLTLKRTETARHYKLAAKLRSQPLIIWLLGCYSWPQRYIASQLPDKLVGASFLMGRLANNPEPHKFGGAFFAPHILTLLLHLIYNHWANLSTTSIRRS